MSQPFLIKHRSSGKFFDVNAGGLFNVVLHSGIDSKMHWRFIKQTKYWGYIEQVSTGLIIHPYLGSLSPGNGTNLVVHSDRHYGALFALDRKNQHVIHKGGRSAQPLDGQPYPDNGTQVVLHSDGNDAMLFQFVSPEDPDKEILVYGHPRVLGKWEIINAVINPGAEHKSTVILKIGKSKTGTLASTFEYKWECSFRVEMEFFKSSVDASVRDMMEKTSSETWTEESIRTREITVQPGNTVVTWQYKFHVEQDESHAIFQSNIVADTDSEDTEPCDLEYAP